MSYPSSPHPYAPPRYPPQVAQTCVDWLIHTTGNIHADAVRRACAAAAIPRLKTRPSHPRTPRSLPRARHTVK